jgi:hypothetical protein
VSPQLKLFEPNFGNLIRRVEINGVVHFSVLDVFEHYGSQGSSEAPSKYWKRAEKRLLKQSSGVLPGLVERIPETGGRPSPYATFKLFMRIVQVSEIREWDAIRNWMADLAQERIEETVNPALGIHRAQDRFIAAKIAQGMSEEEASEFLQAVQEGRITRREWTAALKAAVSGAINYGQITNTEYTTLFEKTAKQISEVTGFKTARDGMTKTGRKMLDTVESALEDAFKQHRDLSFKQALELTRGICADFRVSVQSVQARLGVDLATGTPLLTAGNRGAQ